MLNNPPYIPVDEMGFVVANASVVLIAAGVIQNPLNYQYGYITELNETLTQMGKTEASEPLMFPCVWFAQPFTIIRDSFGWYGHIDDGRLIIMHGTNDEMKATERMTNVFKPILDKIYYEILVQICKSNAFDVSIPSKIPHRVTDRYFWGEDQQSVLGNRVDVKDISALHLKVNNKC
jgi:hypothetical protein